MDSSQEQLKDLSEIRSLMERSSSFISLSGLSGISAGIIGLATAFILHLKLNSYLNYERGAGLSPASRNELIVFCLLLFSGVLILTFALTIFFTTRKAKKKGLAIWDSSAKRLVVSLFIPLVIGGVFCLVLMLNSYKFLYGLDYLILPSMLVFYGLALINASKYTLNELKWLGITEAFIGILALLFINFALYYWALGFGVVNIIYGAAMYYRHER